MTESGDDTVRLFYGIFVPEHLREIMCQAQDGLRKGQCHVKWVERENLHITLRFIGDVPREQVSEYVEAGRRAARRCEPFEADIVGVGAFPHPGRPKVLWTGVNRGKQQVERVYQALSDELKEAGLAEPEERPFTAHCTLGRVRSKNTGKLTQILGRAEGAEIGSMRCDAFSLIASKLTCSGPVYTAVEQFALGETTEQTTEEI